MLNPYIHHECLRTVLTSNVLCHGSIGGSVIAMSCRPILGPGNQVILPIYQKLPICKETLVDHSVGTRAHTYTHLHTSTRVDTHAHTHLFLLPHDELITLARAECECLMGCWESAWPFFPPDNINSCLCHLGKGEESYPDLLALVIAIIVTIIVALGVKNSVGFNNVLNVLNLAVWVFIMIAGLFFINGKYWAEGQFLPHGWSGVSPSLRPPKALAHSAFHPVAGLRHIFKKCCCVP